MSTTETIDLAPPPVVRAPKTISRSWRTAARSEEARTYLQGRLVVLSRLMFWSFVVLLGSLTLLYWVYPEIEPAQNHVIMAGSTGGLATLAILWRGFLIRRTLSMRALDVIDAFYPIVTGAYLAFSAYMSTDLRPAPYACLLYLCFMVLTRAIVVPSTGRRTAVIAIAAFAPFLVAAVGMGLTTTTDIPAPALVCAVAVISTVVGLLAYAGSDTAYGLRVSATAATQLGQYTLDRKIGEGGMGAVFLAHHAMLKRPTAIKLLPAERFSPSTLDRFEREVQHMSQLTHPNTVAVFDYGRSIDGVFYYVMEYLDGIDLERLVRLHGPQPADRVIHVLIQVCGALHEAHERRLVHRDIKPANIILCERGGSPDVVKVVDFGLVKEFTTDTGVSAQLVLGTPSYIAPEVITAPNQIGPAVDLYSLGAVGYFLLTGKRVFEGKNPLEICLKHVTAAPVPPSSISAIHIPARLEAIVMQCLAKAPADRPESARALAGLLRDLPASNDWSELDARGWWGDFRKPEKSFA
ncbi:MAG: protein kinase [Deltaproteobacteria bacterium]|nr:protein kinase [Deltaproteobacteria bacterium]